MGIGTLNPDPSSVLEINATNKGVLVPRLSSQQRISISNPANGLMVFDTDEDCFFFYSTTISTWTNLCNTGGIGPTGATGPTGSSGGPQGPTGPVGASNVEIYGVNGTGELTATSVFQVAPGLSTTFTTTDSAFVNISTYGAISQTSGNSLDSEIQLFLNGNPIASAVQKNGEIGSSSYRSHWTVLTYLILSQGTYTIDVRGRKVGSGGSFNFGSTSTSSSSLIVQIVYD